MIATGAGGGTPEITKERNRLTSTPEACHLTEKTSRWGLEGPDSLAN